MLNEVRSLETVSSGFILNYKGRKLGLHVDSNEDLHDWSRSLLGALAPSDSERHLDISPRGTASQRSRSAPGKSLQIALDNNVIDRMRSNFQTAFSGMPTEKVFKLFDKNKTGSLTSDDAVSFLKSKLGKEASDTEVKQFVTALDIDGRGQIKVERIALFFDKGAVNTQPTTPRAKLNAKMPEGWVPRVATLVRKSSPHGHKKIFIDPEEEATNSASHGKRRLSVMRGRSGGIGLSVQTNETSRRAGGYSWKAHSVNGKVNEDVDPRPQDRKRLPSKDPPHTHLKEKITGHGDTRSICVSKPPGEMMWLKINHQSGNVTADPEHIKTDTRQPLGITSKVGEEDRKSRQSRVCLTDKVTDRDKKITLPGNPATLSTPKEFKVTEAGRTCSGWAQPHRECIFDRSRSFSAKVLSRGASPAPVGLSPRRSSDK